MAGTAVESLSVQPMDPCLGWPLLENRKEPRYVCKGEVLLRPGVDGGWIVGDLVDVSTGGFHAAFVREAPPAGAEVEFRHLFFRGRALVVWTRASGSGSEVGCMILRR